MSRYLFYIAAFVLSGCAGTVTDVPSAGYGDLTTELREQSRIALDEYVHARQRLYHAAMPLYYANTGLCPRRFLNPGFTVYSDFDLPSHLRHVAIERKNLGKSPVVLGVAVLSDAFDKGVRAGDILVLVNGLPVANSAQANTRFSKIKDVDTPVTLGFMRDGVAYSVDVTFKPTCYYPIRYEPNINDINASTNGRVITFTKGIVDFAGDDELSVILAHEMAHNIMHHNAKDTQNMTAIKVASAVVDGVIGIAGLGDVMRSSGQLMMDSVWSRAFEREADYVGLYLVARAGGNLHAAAPLWRRMAVAHGDTHPALPVGPDFTRSHPISAERFVILRNTHDEIEAKRKVGKTLMPNLRSNWNFGERFAWWEADYEQDETDVND